VTTLVQDVTTPQACNGGADTGIVMMGANVGATEVVVVAGLASRSSTSCLGWIARLFEADTPSGAWTLIGAQQGPFTEVYPATHTITWSGISVTKPYLIAWFNMNQPPCCGTWQVVSVDDNFAGAYCVGGTQLTTGASLVYYLTPGLIDTWLAHVGMSWLAPFFTAFWFTYLNAGALCSALPPLTWGSITDDPSQLSPTNLENLLRAIAWQNVCQCTGAATSPPPPFVTEPTGVPTLPTIACDNTNLCATVQDIWQDLAMTQKAVNEIKQTVTLIQRQNAPFAFVTGECHSGLTENGEIAVQGILGLSVSFTGGGASIGEDVGDPVTLFSVGWVNVGDSAGWRTRMYIRSNPWVYFPRIAGEITKIGYSFNPLITAQVCTLVREP
jgi:hypothetical protein